VGRWRSSGKRDAVIIASSGGAGTTVTVDINNAACASLTINPGNNSQTSTLFFNNNSVLTVSGNVAIGANGNRFGIINMTNGGTLIASGTVTLNNGATFTGGTGTLKVGGTITVVGAPTFTAGSGTVEYTGANPAIASLTYQNLTFSGTGTAGAAGPLTIQGNLLIQAEAL
jgi:hypothetical protein